MEWVLNSRVRTKPFLISARSIDSHTYWQRKFSTSLRWQSQRKILSFFRKSMISTSSSQYCQRISRQRSLTIFMKRPFCRLEFSRIEINDFTPITFLNLSPWESRLAQTSSKWEQKPSRYFFCWLDVSSLSNKVSSLLQGQCSEKQTSYLTGRDKILMLPGWIAIFWESIEISLNSCLMNSMISEKTSKQLLNKGKPRE